MNQKSLGARAEKRWEGSAGNALGAMRPIPYMGVIYVVAEAMRLGFWNGHPDWCNLGQGQPEVGEMEGAPPRISEIQMEPSDHAYGPIGGTNELRQAVADHYNRLYRQGKKSKYTAANVSIASGGRLMLSRVFAALGEVTLGYQVPDYTAYEDMISVDRWSDKVFPLSGLARRLGCWASCDDRDFGPSGQRHRWRSRAANTTRRNESA